jgi:small GTP-binding protein
MAKVKKAKKPKKVQHIQPVNPGINEEDLEPGDTPVPGLVLERVLDMHQDVVWFVAWSSDGKWLTTSSKEATFIHNMASGESTSLSNRFESGGSHEVAWTPDSSQMAVSDGYSIHIINADGLEIVETLRTENGSINRLEFSPDGSLLAYSAFRHSFVVCIWNMHSGKDSVVLDKEFMSISFFWAANADILYVFDGFRVLYAYDILKGSTQTLLEVDKSEFGAVIAVSKRYFAIPMKQNIGIWDITTHELKFVLEGHTAEITSLSFSGDGRILASKSQDQTIKFWRCDKWEEIAAINETALLAHYGIEICFNPQSSYFVSRARNETSVRIWKVDPEIFLDQSNKDRYVRYTTAKIVLVGDSGVGKTGLGWRLANNPYKEHDSTHGQQFWIANELGRTRLDGTNCEVVLWDLAGQPDYRLVHSLFLDKIDLGLLLFDPTVRQDPLNAPLFWLRHIHPAEINHCPVILVGSRSDRGTPTLTNAELDKFCRQYDISGGFIAVSARTGESLSELIERIRQQIRWEALKATVTTITFKTIKEFVLSLKADSTGKDILVTPHALKAGLKRSSKQSYFTDEEIMTAVQNLENHGYVSILHSSKGDIFILLDPTLLLNLASSFVLEARRNPKGLGVLEEAGLLAGSYKFPELDSLTKKEREVLLDAATVLFLQHTVCFRENFNDQSFLVFPSLINEKRPLSDDTAIVEDVYYRVTGPVENVFASLVVLLGYTNTFIRNNQWQDQAQYQLGPGEICGFKQVASREGELEIVLYYAVGIAEYIKSLFQGLFERFLSAKSVTVMRYQPVNCPSCAERLARTVVSQQLEKGRRSTYCNNCGGQIALPGTERLVVNHRSVGAEVSEEQAIATRRVAFEAAIVRIKGSLRQQEDSAKAPTCFISYAWGDAKQEQWVNRLAVDLRKAGVGVLFDRWHNLPGSSITEFVGLITTADFAIVVGTPLLQQKYQNAGADAVVKAEQLMINTRLRKPAKYGRRVIPILLEGTADASFTPLLEDVVHVDFRQEQYYFYNLFSVIVRLFELGPDNPFLMELQNTLNPERVQIH